MVLRSPFYIGELLSITIDDNDIIPECRDSCFARTKTKQIQNEVWNQRLRKKKKIHPFAKAGWSG